MSRARDLSRLSNPTNFTADGTTGRVGLGSENPTAKLNVAGIVSATAFYGDGSNLEGVGGGAGLGTAISDTAPGDVIYYTNTILGINTDITIDHPSSANVSYTQYQEIAVESGIDFIVADGDEFIPDVLGLSTEGIAPLGGSGGRVRADFYTNHAGTGAPTFQTGVNVTGIVTATGGSFSGNVSIGGTLTYEDVTNIDSIGIITARSDVSIADKIIHLGDTNTAIRFPAADTFTVETAGSERLRITSDGKFGFKTTSPDYTVDINGELGIKEGQPVTWHDGSGNPAAQIYGDSSSNLIFRTGVAAMGERMRLLPAGGLTFNGDTAAANALDDYEEGTWLPNIGGTATYDIQWGYYIKIGKSVQCWGGLRPNSMGTGNAKQIQNLPFTAINSPGTTYTGGGSIVYHDNSATSIVNTPALAVQPNSTYATINTKTAASIRLQDTNNFWQNNHRANFFITYQTN